VVVDDPSPNFQRNELNVPEPPLALAVKLTWIPTSVGFGVTDVMVTVRVTDGLIVSVVLFELLVTPSVSVAFTVIVNVVAVVTVYV